MASNDSRPVIGLTSYLEPAKFLVWETEAALLHRVYVDCVVAAGGIPVLLPPVSDAHEKLVSTVDALVLTGGADVEPARYGQEQHPTTYTRPNRDAFEFGLFEAARHQGKPVLGVCRGLQVMSVALGGTLTQHLPEATASTEHQPAPATFGRGTVTLAEGSRAAAILGAETKTLCYHHQAIDRLGAGLEPVGWAADGTIEAAEIPGEFTLGVQWHPEQDTDDVRLFRALVEASKERR
ncbi:gamma-glutamyl-gamma-aminobutyrate hydrolase family protein [Amycolatopsis sp. SID8362]|uniref:gamma-glutamyl-gamma-aminobutyrate hydrolase family protein n=1 Tax=Amycolatopsis sp. SID8362 TaxID=2690346 RepID=UPI0013695B9F|nr:gamma-glutamyl-gamma-aminobutyrate hydrolase family protein [Amycolatopsis sp. SID8362]NBH05100.1 gamma-glutamyl-gamma-aminobutyrate hydrolase family protein [Amycolatopsis sp. SID8362]NED41800.1 gamma-glutamyl-gamma-aminobutyrate hydrolase family protein [Amycolatopsis sp. SID8362]